MAGTLWLVDADCEFSYSTPTLASTHAQPSLVHVIGAEPSKSIAVIRQFPPDATAMLTDLTEARPLIQIELTVKIHNFGHKIS
jgi:hypothetical protein